MGYDLNSPNFPDHPVIVHLENTGTPDGIYPPECECPYCGEECAFLYLDMDEKIVGCDCCIRVRCAEDCEDLMMAQYGRGWEKP